MTGFGDIPTNPPAERGDLTASPRGGREEAGEGNGNVEGGGSWRETLGSIPGGIPMNLDL